MEYLKTAFLANNYSYGPTVTIHLYAASMPKTAQNGRTILEFHLITSTITKTKLVMKIHLNPYMTKKVIVHFTKKKNWKSYRLLYTCLQISISLSTAQNQ